MSPIAGEGLYVEFDPAFGWCVFGDKSGFCYSQHTTREAAEGVLP